MKNKFKSLLTQSSKTFALKKYITGELMLASNDINDLIYEVNRRFHFPIKGVGGVKGDVIYRGTKAVCMSLLNGSETKVYLYSQRGRVEVHNLFYITIL